MNTNKIYFAFLLGLFYFYTEIPSNPDSKRDRVMFSECKYSMESSETDTTGQENTQLLNELIKTEMIGSQFFELIDDFVIEKTLKQIRVKQQCGTEDCDLQLGKLLFADYIISCSILRESSKMKYAIKVYNGHGIFMNSLLRFIKGEQYFWVQEQENVDAFKVNIKVYDMKKGRYFQPESFYFAPKDFYLGKYNFLFYAPDAAFVKGYGEARFPQKEAMENFVTRIIEPIKMNGAKEETKKENRQEIAKKESSGKSRILLGGKNGGYETDWNQINHQLIENLSKEYDIIDEDAKKKALKQLEAQQKCGVEDCGINLSKLLNADYNVDLNIEGTTEFIFDVKSKDNRRIQYYKGSVLEYKKYIFSFRDCVKKDDCVKTALLVKENSQESPKKEFSERSKVLVIHGKIKSHYLVEEKEKMSQMMNQTIEDLFSDYDIIDEETKNKALKKLVTQKKCEEEKDCGIELSKMLNADYTVELGINYEKFVFDVKAKDYKRIKYEERSRSGLNYYKFRFRDCLKDGDCLKIAVPMDSGK